MAVFKYRMQNILDIKQKLEESAKMEFSEANARVAAEEEKLSEIEKYRTLLNDPHFEQDDYESHLKIISIYEGIILKEEEKIVPIIMKQPIS